MYCAIYRFEGEPSALLAGYRKMLDVVPAGELLLHVCVQDPGGIEVFDACPTREAFEAFSGGSDFAGIRPAQALGAPAGRGAGGLRAGAAPGMSAMADKPSQAALARLADEAEAAAFADLYAAAPATLAQRLGLAVRRAGGATLLLAPGLPTTMFNRAMGLGWDTPADDAALAAIEQAYCDAQVASWWLHVNPQAQVSGLLERLAARGYTAPARRSWAKVVRATQGAPVIATDFAIRAARADEVPAVTALIIEAFGMPPFMADWLGALHGRPRWRVYAAADAADQPVGGAMLFIDGEVAWLGMGAVRAAHRRRGGQGALMARRIADAHAAGCRLAVTETGEPIGDEPNPSLANMRRCGFQMVASRLNFAAPAA